jgi:hypothetical protein
MSLFIAGQAFSDAGDFAATKIAIVVASLLPGVTGVAILRGARSQGRPELLDSPCGLRDLQAPQKSIIRRFGTPFTDWLREAGQG